MRKAHAVPLAVLALLAGCDNGPSGPDFPDLEGSYTADYTWTFTGTGFSITETCDGTFVVAQQTRGSFTGSFSMEDGGECETVSGTIAGEVREDGELHFVMDTPGGGDDIFEDATGCQVVSSDERLNGTLSAGRINALTNAVLECPTEVGPQRFEIKLEMEATPE